MTARRNDPLRKILWFETKRIFDIDYFDLLQPVRSVSQDPRYKSGTFHSGKCGRAIQYESAVERAFIEMLERDDRVAFYWEQPVKVPFRSGRRKRYYTPDFGVYLRSGRFFIVEVKPLAEMLDHRVEAKTEGLMEFCSRRGFGMLLTDGRHTPADLLKGKVNRKLEKELLAALASHPVRLREYMEIKQRCHACAVELYRAVIRHDLKFSARRFKLQRGNQSGVFRQVYFGRKKYDDLTAAKFSALFGKAAETGPKRSGFLKFM